MIGIAFLANLSKREEYQTKDEQHAGDRDETRLLTVLLFTVRSSGSSSYNYGWPIWFQMYRVEPGRDEYQIYLGGGYGLRGGWFGRTFFSPPFPHRYKL